MLVSELRRLRAREAYLGMPLSEQDAARLAVLEHLFACDLGRDDDRRSAARVKVDVCAELVVDGLRWATRVVEMGPEGLSLAPAPPIQVGARVTLVAVDHALGVDIRLPAQVRWVGLRGRAMAGLALVGVPIELRKPRFAPAADLEGDITDGIVDVSYDIAA